MSAEPSFDQALAARAEAARIRKIGMGTSAWEGLKQGATLGFGDEFAGAAAALGGKLGSLTNGVDPSFQPSMSDNYKAARDDARKVDDDARKANPKMHFAGEAAGTLATAAVMPRLKGLGTAAKFFEAPAIVARALPYAASGALQGAATGLGTSRSDSVAGDVANTALGTGVGGVLGAGGGLLADAAAPVARKGLAALGRGVASTARAAPGVVKDAAGAAGKAAVGAVEKVPVVGKPLVEGTVDFFARRAAAQQAARAAEVEGLAAANRASFGDAAKMSAERRAALGELGPDVLAPEAAGAPTMRSLNAPPARRALPAPPAFQQPASSLPPTRLLGPAARPSPIDMASFRPTAPRPQMPAPVDLPPLTTRPMAGPSPRAPAAQPEALADAEAGRWAARSAALARSAAKEEAKRAAFQARELARQGQYAQAQPQWEMPEAAPMQWQTPAVPMPPPGTAPAERGLAAQIDAIMGRPPPRPTPAAPTTAARGGMARALEDGATAGVGRGPPAPGEHPSIVVQRAFEAGLRDREKLRQLAGLRSVREVDGFLNAIRLGLAPRRTR